MNPENLAGTIMSFRRKTALQLTCAVIMCAMGATGLAQAADLAPPEPEVPVSVPSFGGFFIGPSIGATKTNYDKNCNSGPYNSLCQGPTASLYGGAKDNDDWTFGIGGRAGYNFETSMFVLGAAVDAQFYPSNDNDLNYLAALRGRAGIKLFDDQGLLYGQGGVALAGFRDSYRSDIPLPLVSEGDNAKVGWTVGGGYEHMITQNWSIYGEYNFYKFNDAKRTRTGIFPNTPVSTSDAKIHDIRIGLNYHF